MANIAKTDDADIQTSSLECRLRDTRSMATTQRYIETNPEMIMRAIELA